MSDWDHWRGTIRCRSVVKTGACTSAWRIGLGRSRSLPAFCGFQRRVPDERAVVVEKAADPVKLGLGVIDQPREEHWQDVLEPVRIHVRLQLHTVPAVIDQFRMPVDGLANASRDPTRGYLMDVL